MGWLDSGGGDGYDMLSPDQQQIVDEISVPTPAPDPSSGGLTEDELDGPYLNTDRELFREDTGEPAGSHYENSVHVTQQGHIGMNVGGHVYTFPISEWHALASELADHVAAARRDLEGNCAALERNVAYWKGEAEAVKARVLALAEEWVVPEAGSRQRANTNEDFALIHVREAEAKNHARQLRAALDPVTPTETGEGT